MEPTQIWGDGGTVGSVSWGFVNGGLGLTETQKVRSPFEQNSDHVADGWNRLQFRGVGCGEVGLVGFDEEGRGRVVHFELSAGLTVIWVESLGN